MILEDARDVALHQVADALAAELGIDAPLLIEQAENLIAIAVEHEISVEHVRQWIHYRTPDKEWTTAEFRRWARRYHDTNAELQRIWARESRHQDEPDEPEDFRY